jgi:hypothetical protein
MWPGSRKRPAIPRKREESSRTKAESWRMWRRVTSRGVRDPAVVPDVEAVHGHAFAHPAAFSGDEERVAFGADGVGAGEAEPERAPELVAVEVALDDGVAGFGDAAAEVDVGVVRIDAPRGGVVREPAAGAAGTEVPAAGAGVLLPGGGAGRIEGAEPVGGDFPVARDAAPAVVACGDGDAAIVSAVPGFGDVARRTRRVGNEVPDAPSGRVFDDEGHARVAGKRVGERRGGEKAGEDHQRRMNTRPFGRSL